MIVLRDRFLWLVEKWVAPLLVFAAAFLVLYLLSLPLLQCSTNASCASDLLGDKAPAEYLVNILTLAAIIGGGYLAFRTFRLNQHMAVSGRYQKALELIATGNSASQIGGLYLLRDVAVDSPRRYATPVIRTLAQLTRERHFDLVEKLSSLVPDDAIPDPVTLPRSDPAAMTALRVIGRIPHRLRWNIDGEQVPHYNVTRVYFNEYQIRNRDFTRLNIEEAIVVDHVSFVGCIFSSGNIFEGRLLNRLRFIGCHFAGVGAPFEIALKAIDGGPLEDLDRRIEITNCRGNSLKINNADHSVRLVPVEKPLLQRAGVRIG